MLLFICRNISGANVLIIYCFTRYRINLRSQFIISLKNVNEYYVDINGLCSVHDICVHTVTKYDAYK